MGHMKEKRCSAAPSVIKKEFAQRERNIVSKQGQLEVIKLLANQEVSRN